MWLIVLNSHTVRGCLNWRQLLCQRAFPLPRLLHPKAIILPQFRMVLKGNGTFRTQSQWRLLLILYDPQLLPNLALLLSLLFSTCWSLPNKPFYILISTLLGLTMHKIPFQIPFSQTYNFPFLHSDFVLNFLSLNNQCHFPCIAPASLFLDHPQTFMRHR